MLLVVQWYVLALDVRQPLAPSPTLFTQLVTYASNSTLDKSATQPLGR